MMMMMMKIHGTGSARKLAVVSKAHALELGHIDMLTYFDRKFFPSENCSTSAKPVAVL
jgi:hypothetical protein